MTKIMVVEDDQSLREIYSIRLTAEGYEVCSAGDGEEALAIAVKERPDLVISDVMMPKISGFDMLDILRSTPETKDIKVIMMTALSSDDQRKRGENLGADKYLVKSQVGIEDVIAAVHEVLGGAAGAPMPAQPTPPAIPADQQMAIPQPVAAPDEPAPAPAPAAPAQPAPAVPAPEVPAQPVAPAPAPEAPVATVAPQPAAPAPEMSAPAPVAPAQPAPAPVPPVPVAPQGDINAQPAQPAAPAAPAAPAQ
ncbi:response regulator [Candidatus Saccharibacteria bacterium]|nr:response regulator [Candidatus Saccharibacteria bacterium]MBR6122070.1 response regulator [Candidatus Saccharibacteria bacterium]